MFPLLRYTHSHTHKLTLKALWLPMDAVVASSLKVNRKKKNQKNPNLPKNRYIFTAIIVIQV